MGDLGARPALAFNRALWTAPLEDEQSAPRRRIIHARALQLHAPTRLYRLGVRRAPGYHTCGSREDLDWVQAFRVRVWTGNEWVTRRYERGLGPSAPGTITWFDLDVHAATAAIIEVRRCGIDGWWTPWNLAEHAFLLEGEPVPPAPRNESTLELTECSLSALPAGLTATQDGGTVRFRSDVLDVGFYLNRAGFSFLRMAERGLEGRGTNLLHLHPGTFYQGVHLHPVGSAPVIAPSLRCDVVGTTQVESNRVTYALELGTSGQQYRLQWIVRPDRLILQAERNANAPLRAWTSSAWQIGLRSTASPAHVLGALRRAGETGAVHFPAWLHAPAVGSLRVQSTAPSSPSSLPDDDGAPAGSAASAFMRSNVYRSQDLITAELKLGERPQSTGDYVLAPGRHEATIEWVVDAPATQLRPSAPDAVRKAVRRCGLTALTYRPDTATLSNNGASIHCPICMDHWAETTTRLGPILPNLDATYFLRTSLERWLEGGPGYASGHLLQDDGTLRDAEDEYLMAGSACLLGLALFLRRQGTVAWTRRYQEAIRDKVRAMRQRDLDGDGLIESAHRTGVSGSGQWSTCWLDVISFGWKDAFANALLYRALTLLAETLPRLGVEDPGAPLTSWAAMLREQYKPTFFNPDTGWLAGWRCADDALHDYAFLPVNGAAVNGGLLDDQTAHSVMARLWAEAQRVGLPDPALGLPCNLRPIPDADRADIMQGYPFGYYQNGGRTHSQARHFVRALYRVGMNDEADQLLERLCHGLATHQTYGPSKSGLDWRYWDGRPCGYEGLLTDQFGVIGLALERYGEGG